MRRFDWIEISGEKDCLSCACLGERSILTRTLKLIEGNDASVRLECPSCGFKVSGVVSVDGSDPEPIRRSIHPLAHTHAPPTYNLPALPDPPTPAPDYKPPKTDVEAVRMAFGEVVPADEFEQIISGMFEPRIEIGEPSKPGYWYADLKVTPTRIRMGEVETMDMLVEYHHQTQGTVYTCRYSSTAGLPDVDKELAAVRNSCLAVARPSAPVAPRENRAGVANGPVAVVSNGWGSVASVADAGDPVHAKLMNAFRGGG